MMRAYRVALALLTLMPASLLAQEQEPEFAKHLFPPELVMQHQQTLRLTAEQRSAITQGIRELQLKVVDLQWKMQEEAQKLNELVRSQMIDEMQTLTQVDRVLGVEREIKRAHMALLIRIKNTLTAEQQAALAAIRAGQR